ncbi:hypothetical protein BH24ACT5_BH24ACT5_29970 [soil metagenome]
MKVLVIARVRSLGVPTIRTVHHPDNEAPIALNRRLGYVVPSTCRQPGERGWVRAAAAPRSCDPVSLVDTSFSDPPGSEVH